MRQSYQKKDNAFFSPRDASLPRRALAHGMALAANEARKWMGATAPNPPVGATALNAQGHVLAVAAHHKAGEDHAEQALLKICRAQNLIDQVHTLCVTLEPCNHHGRTPPCTKAILEAGIKHVAVGVRDPNPHITGGGCEKLRQEGIKIIEGVQEEICRPLIYAFEHNAKTGKPWLTVKRAFTPEGSMIPPRGQKCFTSPESLHFAHCLRKRADAILTGSGTILADLPLFTVRNVADHKGKKRPLVILDRRKRVPESYLQSARDNGFVTFVHHDLVEALEALSCLGAHDILVEAGPILSQEILKSGLWMMDVKITKDKTDKIDASFNADSPPSFDINSWKWDYMLPNNGEDL